MSDVAGRRADGGELGDDWDGWRSDVRGRRSEVRDWGGLAGDYIPDGRRLRGRRQANKSHLIEMMIESEDLRDV